MEAHNDSLLTFEDDTWQSPSGIHPSLLTRKIIHIDMDAFYASIEERDNPALRGHPVIVGGRPDSRGVVATCNYEARKYGIRSAMGCSKAYRLCSHAIFLPCRFDVYTQVSRQVKEILLSYSKEIEMLSLDEGFIDVTEISRSGATATEIANAIRKEILETTKLTCSAGVAPNKMLAKISTDQNKPNGVTVLKPTSVLQFMQSLPLAKIPFVGPRAQGRLKALGWQTCGDVKTAGLTAVVKNLGGWGLDLWKQVHGIDESAVCSRWNRKSYGEEETYARDVIDENEVLEKIRTIAISLFSAMQARNMGFQNITLKARRADFQIVNRSVTVHEAVRNLEELDAIARKLWDRSGLAGTPVRLLGLSVSGLCDAPESVAPASLFDSEG